MHKNLKGNENILIYNYNTNKDFNLPMDNVAYDMNTPGMRIRFDKKL